MVAQTAVVYRVQAGLPGRSWIMQCSPRSAGALVATTLGLLIALAGLASTAQAATADITYFRAVWQDNPTTGNSGVRVFYSYDAAWQAAGLYARFEINEDGQTLVHNAEHRSSPVDVVGSYWAGFSLFVRSWEAKLVVTDGTADYANANEDTEY